MSGMMRREIDGMKNEMSDLKSMFRRTMVSVAQLKGEFVELKDYLKDNMATKDDISALNARMDGFSGLLLDSRQRWAVHADTLKQHHDRLTKLESQRD
ncbi:MAG: hypothetical protein KGM24_07115 [Elusimicrobia bacterium]|nr:hypothetical protein [Elusimicrobiota bacterium]